MYTGTISMRYARALLMFANEAGVADVVYREALTLRRSFREVPALRQAMEKPVMTRDNKKRVLVQAAGGKISGQMQKFFDLVRRNRQQDFAHHHRQIQRWTGGPDNHCNGAGRRSRHLGRCVRAFSHSGRFS